MAQFETLLSGARLPVISKDALLNYKIPLLQEDVQEEIGASFEANRMMLQQSLEKICQKIQEGKEIFTNNIN